MILLNQITVTGDPEDNGIDSDDGSDYLDDWDDED